jgi:hypothetical protein
MKSVVPARGVVDLDAKGSPRVIHHGEKGETSLAIAANYLDLTSIYSKVDLAAALDKQMPELRGGLREPKDIAIPHLVTVVPKLGDEARLGWPADKALRGIFLTTDGGPKFPKILQSLADRDMNAIVLDGKDYEGYFAYPSGVPLAKDTHANQRASVRSLARAVRFAHERGVRIIMRNSCFHDPWLAKQRPDLSVKSRTGKPYPLQWVDPSNEKVQEFILAVIGEQLDAGVDEIQLDYIRYPVRGIEGADFRLSERGLTQGKVIAEFVKKVHTLTKSRNVPLSLDVFGVAAWNRPEDVVPLGQDLRVLGAESEALSPMVYPSHFAPGFQGLAEPGAHPEVIGLGTRATLNVLASANVKTVVRPWLQAFPWKSPGYGSKYIADEIRSAEQSGATGWLLWHPGGDYGVAWKAIPPKHRMASL